jgi:hypothetical protein
MCLTLSNSLGFTTAQLVNDNASDGHLTAFNCFAIFLVLDVEKNQQNKTTFLFELQKKNRVKLKSSNLSK